MGNWKAVRPAPDAKLELYNLKNDLGETRILQSPMKQIWYNNICSFRRISGEIVTFGGF